MLYSQFTFAMTVFDSHSPEFIILRQILQERPIKNIDWGSTEWSITYQEQLVKAIDHLPYPPHSTYLRKFYKTLFNYLENKRITEVSELLVERCVHYSTTDDASKETYKTYFIDKGCIEPIYIFEENCLFNQGTTGLRTWKASRCLAQFLINHSDLVKGKRIIELGSGTGFLGITCQKLGAEKVWLTDHHPTVLKRLQHNVEINGIQKNTFVFPLDWEYFDVDGIEDIKNPDVIICSDVAFDDILFTPLLNVIIELLLSASQNQPQPTVLVASTLRRKDTFERFLFQAENLGFINTFLEAEDKVDLFYNEDESSEVAIVQLKLKLNI